MRWSLPNIPRTFLLLVNRWARDLRCSLPEQTHASKPWSPRRLSPILWRLATTTQDCAVRHFWAERCSLLSRGFSFTAASRWPVSQRMELLRNRRWPHGHFPYSLYAMRRTTRCPAGTRNVSMQQPAGPNLCGWFRARSTQRHSAFSRWNFVGAFWIFTLILRAVGRRVPGRLPQALQFLLRTLQRPTNFHMIR